MLNFEVPKWLKIALEILNSRKIPQIWAIIDLYPPLWLEKILNFEVVEWLKLHLKSFSNSRKIPSVWENTHLFPPPWLEKTSNFEILKWQTLFLTVHHGW